MVKLRKFNHGQHDYQKCPSQHHVGGKGYPLTCLNEEYGLRLKIYLNGENTGSDHLLRKF
jgi:hypothetical protein